MYVLAIALATLLITSACGDSGGGSSDDGDVSAPARSGPTLEVFQASIDAIDPDARDVVITIDAGAAELDPDDNPVGALPALGATFADGNLASAQVEWIAYPRGDGTLQRVSTDSDAGTPTPIRVSSEFAALPYCDARLANDLGDPENARLAYGRGAPTCSDPLDWRVVTLSDDASTAPRAFPGEPLEALVDPATGAHLGWLALDDDRLIRLAPDLAAAATELLTGIVRGEAIGATGDGRIFLELDQALYAYDPVAERLTDLDFEFIEECPCSEAFASDRQFGFFVDAGELHRANPRSGGSVQPIDAPENAFPSFDAPDFVVVGSDHVAWSFRTDVDGDPLTTGDQCRFVHALPRDGGEALELDDHAVNPNSLPEYSGFVAAASDEWLFYNRFTALSTGPTAMAVRLEGGQARLSLGALWVGSSRAPVVGPGNLGPVVRMLRLTGVLDPIDLGNSLNHPTLQSTDPDDPREDRSDDVQLGSLPAGGLFAWALPGYGPSRVGVMLSPDGGSGLQVDLIAWDDLVEDSLERVTSTPGMSEWPVSGF